MIKYVTGNLLEAKEDIIGHQVNTIGAMGAGLAKQIRSKYPAVYEDYRDFCKTNKGKTLLGRVYMAHLSNGKSIANLFGQMSVGRNRQQTDYDALRRALSSLRKHTETNSLSVALPYGLGCGLAGGDWEIVSKIIEEVFEDYEVTVYKLG